MPFRSTAQQKWAFGTDQPFARRWAHETDFGSLPKRVRLKLRKQRISAKAWSDAARAAAIAKRRANAAHTSDQRNLDQARHDAQQLRSRHVAHPTVPKLPKGRGGGKKPAAGRKPVAPKKTDAQRQAEQQAREQRSEDRYQQHAQEREQRYQAHRTQIETERQQREAERRQAQQQQKPKKGGGGGKKKGPKETTPEQQAREQQRQERQRMLDARRERLDAERRQRQEQQDQARQQQAIERTRVTTPQLAGLTRQLSEGKRALDAGQRQSLIRNGLAKEGKDGTLVLTGLGQRALRQKAERFGGKKRSQLSESDFAGPNRTFPIMTAQDVTGAARLIGKATNPDAVKRRIIAIAKRKGLPLPDAWRTHQKARSTFYVFKDASGAWRWVGLSSNAFKDRDEEIVSTRSLADDVVRADSDRDYGPLRWWHVGVPFGPGLDLGDCDFNAMVGRILVESGTFRTPVIGQAVAAKADQLQLSIGFVHPPDEPHDGIFTHIRRFERSLVPRGKAANPFTHLIVKESPMDETKMKALADLLGIPAEQVQNLVVANAKAIEEKAVAGGVAFKADQGMTETIVVDGVTYARVTEKADMSDTVTEDALPPEEGEEMADNGMLDEGGDENMLTPAECEQIAQTVAERVLAQLAPMLDLEKKMAAHADALKGAMNQQMGAYTAKKDAEAAETKQTILDLQTKLKEAQGRLATLEGDAPRGIRAGFKASESASTVVTEADPRYKEQPKADPLDEFVGGFILNNGAAQGPGAPAA